MRLLYDFLQEGGPVMFALLVLSIMLYSRCSRLILSLWRSGRQLNAFAAWRAGQLPVLRRLRSEMEESFGQQRLALAAMVAAAPLLGLLGTVSGMVKTFESLATRAEARSMGDLAQGISQVLVATESGLAVAIPALVIIGYLHGQVRRYLQRLDQIEAGIRRGSVP